MSELGGLEGNTPTCRTLPELRALVNKVAELLELPVRVSLGMFAPLDEMKGKGRRDYWKEGEGYISDAQISIAARAIRWKCGSSNSARNCPNISASDIESWVTAVRGVINDT